ncbi:MAG: carboxylating nicotinate-nucleotide diphosphorylase [Nitrosomonadales bacterium]|nr:carboxylating nicotinate-nucleotide diphosphorylase [Nitrosomonadales bacterium]
MLDNVLGALAEDIGSGNLTGDFTAQLIPVDQQSAATIISREPAVICGLPWAQECFLQLDDTISVDWQIQEGDTVSPNQILARLSGNARAMLTAERCALNFLQTLSATATETRKFVDAIKGSKASILDTRKTIPGLRLAQKYAVLVGGGINQRLGLYDGILIKENHIAAAGGIRQALAKAHQINTNISIQIEVENLRDLHIALESGANSILLDNFSSSDLAEAVKINNRQAILEASGGITLDNVRTIALTGVDRISIGQLTKHIQAIDLSMRFE